MEPAERVMKLYEMPVSPYKPIAFGCARRVPLALEELGERILAAAEGPLSAETTELTLSKPDAIGFRRSGFARPLSALATHVEETWLLDRTGERETLVTRCFALHPANRRAAMALRVFARMLRRDVSRHLARMAGVRAGRS